MSNINNIDDLRKAVIEDRKALKAGKINVQTANEFSRQVAEVSKTIKLELEEAKINGEKADIPFLKYKK